MEELKPLILLLVGGLSFRFALTLTGQVWARSYAQTASFMLLPVITYVITKTITGNIALSLGMIGALSIVRFRHPVKSALELIMYFDLITLGIAASVRTKWAVQLILFTIIIIAGVRLIQKILKRYNKSFYNVSFNEGVALNSIEVYTKERIDIVEKNKNLKNIVSQPDQNEFVYRLAFENKEQLDAFKKEIEDIKGIKKIDVNFV